MKPLVLVNFKNYGAGLKLAKVISGFRSRYRLMVAPSLIDLSLVCKNVRVPVLAQHVDNLGFGASTGSISLGMVKKVGCRGTLLNHSEKRISVQEIGERVRACKKLGLISIVCASGLGMMKKVLRFNPDYIAYEPKKLVGGNKSVTSSNPKVISKAVKLVGSKLLVGAGIHSKKDVLKALELGASGVLVAHKIVKAKNPLKVLKQMFT
ncbi:triose-phosphate isomerase [Candidatus Woesearchaeota archaeon]|nr:triose-phosphate isomerase [Candidatus Woesearchaeota archaeon]